MERLQGSEKCFFEERATLTLDIYFPLLRSQWWPLGAGKEGYKTPLLLHALNKMNLEELKQSTAAIYSLILVFVDLFRSTSQITPDLIVTTHLHIPYKMTLPGILISQVSFH